MNRIYTYSMLLSMIGLVYGELPPIGPNDSLEKSYNRYCQTIGLESEYCPGGKLSMHEYAQELIANIEKEISTEVERCNALNRAPFRTAHYDLVCDKPQGLQEFRKPRKELIDRIKQEDQKITQGLL